MMSSQQGQPFSHSPGVVRVMNPLQRVPSNGFTQDNPNTSFILQNGKNPWTPI